jgi:hypothetical protein
MTDMQIALLKAGLIDKEKIIKYNQKKNHVKWLKIKKKKKNDRHNL